MIRSEFCALLPVECCQKLVRDQICPRPYAVHVKRTSFQFCAKMVFFSCDACGESMKKNRVEWHYTVKCKNCSVLSCLDCGKDFW